MEEKETTPVGSALALPDARGIDPRTGEIMPDPMDTFAAQEAQQMLEAQRVKAEAAQLGIDIQSPYVGLSEQKAFSKEVQDILGRAIDPEEIEIRPDGLIYWPGAFYRERLNEALGQGAWCLVCLERWYGTVESTMYYRAALYCNGVYCAEAIGDADYWPNNPQQSYATAVESAKTNALVRCCKDMGIANELWKPKFSREFVASRCMDVWVEAQADYGKNVKKGQKKKLWRLRSSPPIDTYPWLELDGKRPQQPQQQSPTEAQKGGSARRGSLDPKNSPQGTTEPQKGKPVAGKPVTGKPDPAPARPWGPSQLQEMLQRKAAQYRKKQEQLKGANLVYADPTTIAATVSEAFGPDFHLGTAALTYLFGQPGITPQQGQAFLDWYNKAGEEANRGEEIARLIGELVRDGHYRPPFVEELAEKLFEDDARANPSELPRSTE